MRCSLLVNLVLTFSLLPFLGMAQQRYNGLSDLYNYVEQTDKVLNESQKTFYLEKFLKDDYNYKETWRYSLKGGHIVFFQVDYILDSSEFSEVYYLQRGNLICSEEYEKINYSSMEDELKWGGIYYFQSTTPRHVVTLGKRKLGNRLLNPGTEALTRFEKRFSELKRHLPMLPD